MNEDVTKPQNLYRFRLFAFLLPLVAHIVLLAVLFLHQEPKAPPQKALLRVQTVQLGKPSSPSIRPTYPEGHGRFEGNQNLSEQAQILPEMSLQKRSIVRQESLPVIAPMGPVKEETKEKPVEETAPTEEPELVVQKDEVIEKKPLKKEAKVEEPPAKPKQETKAKSAHKKEEKAPKKESSAPKKESKKSSSKKEKTSSPKKESTAPSSSDALAEAALGILDNLKKKGSAAAEKVTGAIRAPAGLSSLKSSAAVHFDSPAYLSQRERSYQDEIAYTLQYNLVLPEQGEVVVSLTLLSDGKVKTVKIVRAESSKNSDYVSRKVKELHFSSFKDLFKGDKDHTFVITLCNK